MPVGSAHRFQHLVRVTRTGRDNYDHEDLEEVAFVPLIGFGATEEGCSSSTSSSVTSRRAIVPLLAVSREPGGLRCAIRLPRPGHRPGPIRAKAARLSLRSPGAAVGHSGGDPRRLHVGDGGLFLLTRGLARKLNRKLLPGIRVTDDLVQKVEEEYAEPESGKKLSRYRRVRMPRAFASTNSSIGFVVPSRLQWGATAPGTPSAPDTPRLPMTTSRSPILERPPLRQPSPEGGGEKRGRRDRPIRHVRTDQLNRAGGEPRDHHARGRSQDGDPHASGRVRPGGTAADRALRPSRGAGLPGAPTPDAARRRRPVR